MNSLSEVTKAAVILFSIWGVGLLFIRFGIKQKRHEEDEE